MMDFESITLNQHHKKFIVPVVETGAWPFMTTTIFERYHQSIMLPILFAFLGTYASYRYFVKYRQMYTENSKPAIMVHERLQEENNILRRRWEENMLNIIALSVGSLQNTTPALNFGELSKQSPCLFAKTSKIASHTTWNYDLTLEQNILHSLPSFYLFINKIKRLDGFVFELPSELYGRNLCEFSLTVKRVLSILSENDPAGLDCMKADFISKAGWCFSFDTETFFITTFGSIYPKTHSRHCPMKNKMYILIQPEESFYIKKLPEDHGPNMVIKDIRDKIRYNFQRHLCPYYVPPTASYPMADHIVKPLVDVAASYKEDDEVDTNDESAVTNLEIKNDHIVKFYLHDLEKVLLMDEEEYNQYVKL